MSKMDGEAAARRAAVVLTVASQAETAVASLKEESAKIDVKFTFKHSFRNNVVKTIHAQIKSGNSYRYKSTANDVLTLQNINYATIEALHGSGTPGLILWVPPKPMDRVYWYATDPRGNINSRIKVKWSQYIRPSIIYDLSRLCEYSAWTKNYSCLTVSNIDQIRLMAKAKTAYKLLKNEVTSNMFLGEFYITRSAWRHITRRSKTTSRRELSLRVTPYLRHIINRVPDRYTHNTKSIETCGKRIVEQRELICWYRGSLQIDGLRHSLIVRYDEVISYPKRWMDYPLSATDVRRETKLASWWCKPVK